MKWLIHIFLFLTPAFLYSQEVDSVYYDTVIHFDGLKRSEMSFNGEWVGTETKIIHRSSGGETVYECYKKIGHNYYTKNDLGESIRITVMSTGNVILRNEEHNECYTVYRKTE